MKKQKVKVTKGMKKLKPALKKAAMKMKAKPKGKTYAKGKVVKKKK